MSATAKTREECLAEAADVLLSIVIRIEQDRLLAEAQAA